MAERDFGRFEVVDVKGRKLRNGNVLQLVLECPYDRVKAKSLEDFRYGEVNVKMGILAMQGGLGIKDKEPKAPTKKKS